MPQIVQFREPHVPAMMPARVDRPPAVPATDQVYVVFTSIDDTIPAVRVAWGLARALGSGVTVVHFRPVDFGAPLDSPGGMSPAESEAFKARLEAAGCPATVQVCLCRDARRVVPIVFHEHALVVIGRHRHWWPTPADRWRRTLEATGHFVLMVNVPAA
jgi:hypothetical protein